MTSPRTYPWASQFNGHNITFRHMTVADKELFKTFIRSLPDEDNFYLRLDVRNDQSIDTWMRGIEAGRTLSVIALENDQMVGYCNVHLSDVPWTRHVAEIRISVSRANRGQGLGEALAREVFGIARSQGLLKIWARMPSSQKAAQKVFQSLGFQAEALLADFVMDSAGRTQDMIIMSYDVTGFVN